MHLIQDRIRCAALGAALCAATIALDTPANAGAGGHLYVQSGNAVARYPLQRGIPGTNPDLTIRGYGGAIAVAPDGTVYALKFGRGAGMVIYAFAAGATTPSRRIVMPKNRSCSLIIPPVEALTVDPRGYLFVLAVYSASGARHSSAHPFGNASLPCVGAYVYSPTASGRAQPQQTIALDSFYFGGIAVDRRDHFYAALTDDSATNEYEAAVHNPQVVRTLTPANPTNAVATDGRGNAYLFDIAAGTSSIDVWTPQTPGGSQPARSIGVAYPYNAPAGMVVANGLAYIDNPQTGSVGIFDAQGSGLESPVGVLSVSKLGATIAVGP